jgi:hypothetical protein
MRNWKSIVTASLLFAACGAPGDQAYDPDPSGELSTQVSELTDMPVMASGGLDSNYRCGLTGCICKGKGSPDCAGIGGACNERSADLKCTRDFDCPKSGGGVEPCSKTEGDLCWCLHYPPTSDPNEPFGKHLFTPGVYKNANSAAIYNYDGKGRSCAFTWEQYLGRCQPAPTMLDDASNYRFVTLTADMMGIQTCTWAQSGDPTALSMHQWFPDRRYYQLTDTSVHLLIGERDCILTSSQWSGVAATGAAGGLIGLSVAGTGDFSHAFGSGLTCKSFELIY